MSRTRLPALRLSIGLAALFCAAGAAAAAAALTAPVEKAGFAAKIGVELDGLGDGARARPFGDVAKTLRPWAAIGGQSPAPVDARGWPTSDAQSVMFDIRPFGTWLGPDQIDDPRRFQPDWSGVYRMSFKGQAKVGVAEGAGCGVSDLRYDAAKNLTTGAVTVPKGTGLLVLAFTATRRSPGAATGSGITELHLLRPGAGAGTFTPEFLRSLKPFAVLRFMDWLETNYQPGFYGDPGHHALNWADRRLPDDATQQSDGRKHGAAWEYVVQLANQTGKDLWINIPIAATDNYVLQLARMLKRDLSPKLRIYVEHSNEVWNFGFPQYIYNKLAAIDEVKRGGSPLQNDGNADQEEWARRRHAKRLVEIGNTFRKVFGETGASGRIRPVYASWVIFPDAYYANVLAWVEKTYGPPKQLFYGLAGAAYYNAEKAPANASPAQVLEAMRASSRENGKFLTALQQIAGRYGLRNCQYEVGPDTGGGKTENVANRIEAHRLPAMREVVLQDARRWFSQGGDLYMYFSHCSAYSRYGCWGLSEEIADLNTPKWRAIYELTGPAR
jgi:hypothetical protein